MNLPNDVVSSKTQTLFRPVGLAELALVFDSGMKEFPPRLAEQPIFYPVTNQPYARQIAKDWNAPAAPGFAGYVTQFDLPIEYLSRFPVKTVGETIHQELWVPAEELPEFNSKIVGRIQTVDAYFGESFAGFIPENFILADKDAKQQFVTLAETIVYSSMDFICETGTNAKTVYLNYPFWNTFDFTPLGVTEAMKKRVLDALAHLWSKRQPDLQLCKGTI